MPLCARRLLSRPPGTHGGPGRRPLRTAGGRQPLPARDRPHHRPHAAQAGGHARQIEQLCGGARARLRDVCVNPAWVPLCADLLRGPERACARWSASRWARPPPRSRPSRPRARCGGACEVDMVLNVGALKSGDYRLVERDIAAVVEAAARAAPRQGDHRGRAPHRRREGEGVPCPSRGRRLRQDLHRLRSGRGHRRRRRPDAARGGRTWA